MQLNERQEKIVEIVKEQGPITGEKVADMLHLTRASLRPDLAFLTQIGLLEARPRVGYYYKGKQNPFSFHEQMNELKVADYQSAPVTVDESTSVYNGIVTMFVEDVGTLFVVNEQQELEGISSRKDMLKIAIGKADINQLPIGVIMTRMPNIVVAYEDESLWDVAKRMIEHQIDGMPVVRKNENGRLKVVGRVTKTNVTKAFVALGNQE
ncbi:MAG: helix-turn-helix transcriptional regulator [Peptococcaceae bacterium]|jgi:CBS domain-containing protein|nr:helix-turn-helix transcriptional regulator [Peptococcaceae bacterium]MBQ2013585.1 helix-turn-helix transcriptional regulator [Peptococcaceae bacterium]MBQ2035071.1 helix-turn-helix transcriptional regulator [Peptococcaceae bacterium]MBQ2448643.1 helix-turn-helix transcriptional regulator [Peptococcaceae bacterium]MBQ5652834.1 helix-turn-helix transcriptional regulator [Peptococcaceae bacterium]